MPRLFLNFARLSGSHQAGGTEVSSSHLPLLDFQWLLAGLAVTMSVLPATSADSVVCPSLPLQMIFFHMFEIFCRLRRKSSYMNIQRAWRQEKPLEKIHQMVFSSSKKNVNRFLFIHLDIKRDFQCFSEILPAALSSTLISNGVC